MATFRLNLVYSGVDLDDDDAFECLAELPHVLWRTQGGYAFATADVEAHSALQAANLVAREIAAQVPAARPIRLDEDLVAISDIAGRIGVTRQAVHNWANGIRQANFPPPRSVVGEGIKVWAWSEVNTWLRNNLNLGDQVVFPHPSEVPIINALFDRDRQAVPASAVASWRFAQETFSSSFKLSIKPAAGPPRTDRRDEAVLSVVGGDTQAA